MRLRPRPGRQLNEENRTDISIGRWQLAGSLRPEAGAARRRFQSQQLESEHAKSWQQSRRLNPAGHERAEQYKSKHIRYRQSEETQPKEEQIDYPQHSWHSQSGRGDSRQQHAGDDAWDQPRYGYAALGGRDPREPRTFPPARRGA